MEKHPHADQNEDGYLFDLNEEIESMQKRIEHLEETIPHDSARFTGIAFVSLNLEKHKRMILDKSYIPTFWEKLDDICSGNVPD